MREGQFEGMGGKYDLTEERRGEREEGRERGEEERGEEHGGKIG